MVFICPPLKRAIPPIKLLHVFHYRRCALKREDNCTSIPHIHFILRILLFSYFSHLQSMQNIGPQGMDATIVLVGQSLKIPKSIKLETLIINYGYTISSLKVYNV